MNKNALAGAIAAVSIMEGGLCPYCVGAGCLMCDYTGSEPVGEPDWFEAAKAEAERKIIDNQQH